MNATSLPAPACADTVFERRCLLAALGLVAVMAWCSLGFHHNDEHYQVLEFAGLKLGVTPAADLPWEYRDRIRSWFQPAVALLAVKGFGVAGITSPFLVAAFLRLVSGLLYLAALARLIRVSRPWFETTALRRLAVAAACLLWFVPYLAVRFSGESWSGSLFFLGFASLLLAARGESVSLGELALAGLAMGLAFAARFQTMVLIGAGLAWWVWAGRPKLPALGAVLAGLTVAVAGSLVLDRWGYGEWGLTPWRYIDVQVLQGTAARRFGASPWWWYFPKVVLSAGPPIGVALTAGVLAGWVRRPAAGLTWVTLGFVGTHLLLAHKELRFLFPIVPAIPFVAAMGLEGMPAVTRWFTATRGGRALLALTLALNVAGFGLRAWLPARQEIGIQRAIYRSGTSDLLLVNGKNPFVMGRLPSHFYRDPRLVTEELPDSGGPRPPDRPSMVATLGPPPWDTTAVPCEVLYRTFPAWLEREPFWSRLRWAEPLPWRLSRCAAGSSHPGSR